MKYKSKCLKHLNPKEKPMTDKEFENLQKEIEKKLMEVSKLQSKFMKETGRQFILGQPIVSPKTNLWDLGKKY